MRKTTLTPILSLILLGAGSTASFAGHPEHPTAEGMAGMEGMANIEGMASAEGMAAGGGAMPMKGMGMMPMMMGMMEMMPTLAMMPMGGQSMSGMTDMANTGAAPQAVSAGLEAKLDLLINSIDSLTARIEKLETPAAN